MNNMQQLLKQAQEMQEKISKIQGEIGKREVTGSSGAGLVTVVSSLNGEMKKISIDSSIINLEDKEVLEDLIVAATNDARSKGEKIVESEMSGLTGGLDISKLGLGG